MNQDIRSKIAKVYELVNKGVDGEKEAAKTALDRLLKKHNLSEKEVQHITKKTYIFKYATQLDILLFQQLLYYFVADNYCNLYKSSYRRKILTIDLEYLDYVTMICSYEYYRNHMRLQYNKTVLPQIKRCRTAKTKRLRREELIPVFFSKYILKSGIYKNNQVSKRTEKYTQKELANLLAIQGIEGGRYKQQISNGLYLTE